MRRATVCAALLGLLACATAGGAATIYVHWNGSGDYTTIQAGMDAAAATGDEVVVASGTYYIDNAITYDGKEVMLRAEFSRGAIIDCQGVTGAVRFDGEGANAQLLGFTIQNGHAGYGGAIYCEGGTLATISDCLIMNCSAERGGGIYAHQSNVAVMATEIMWCSATEHGGGIYSYWGADASFVGLTLGGNTAPYGGGMYLWGSSPMVHLCTLYRNTGGAIHVRGSTAGLTIMQTILAFSATGKGVSCEDEATPFVGYCDIYGNAGGDDVCGTPYMNGNEDPRFCGIDEGDVTLCANSGCLPGGISPTFIGAWGEGCEDCASPVAPTTWGAVKALFR